MCGAKPDALVSREKIDDIECPECVRLVAKLWHSLAMWDSSDDPRFGFGEDKP